jgi:hypothetical protein
MVNPLLPDLQQAGFGSYWWVIDQCEYATDLLFKERGVLETVRDDLVAAAMTGFGATDVLRFLDRKPHPAFTGEVTIDRKTRPEGCRVKFRLKANSIKLYDHQSVLRIETTTNNPPGIQGSARDRPERRQTTPVVPDGQVGGAFPALCPSGRWRQPTSDRRPGHCPAHGHGHAGTR